MNQNFLKIYYAIINNGGEVNFIKNKVIISKLGKTIFEDFKIKVVFLRLNYLKMHRRLGHK